MNWGCVLRMVPPVQTKVAKSSQMSSNTREDVCICQMHMLDSVCIISALTFVNHKLFFFLILSILMQNCFLLCLLYASGTSMDVHLCFPVSSNLAEGELFGSQMAGYTSEISRLQLKAEFVQEAIKWNRKAKGPFILNIIIKNQGSL